MRSRWKARAALALLIAFVGCDAAAPAAGKVKDATAALDASGVQDAAVDAAVDAVIDAAVDAAVDAGCTAGAPCDDGDPCTVGDRCLGGSCGPGVFVCDCAKDADCAGLEDGDLCNGTLRCDDTGPAPRCVVDPATVVSCDPSGEVCSTRACDPKTGKCTTTPAAKGTPCVDGDACTVDSACEGGTCVGGADSWCACASDADCAASDQPCLGARFCDKSQFPYTCKVNPAQVVTCAASKGGPCLVNACDMSSGKCEVTAAELAGELCVEGVGCLPVSTGKSGGTTIPCDDGDPCTQGETCSKGSCKGGNDVCVCTKEADCAAQEDGDPCTGVLYCDIASGKCVTNPATVISCPSVGDTACVKNTCQPSDGSCKPTPVKTATPCDDGDPCTAGDLCVLGTCKSGTQVCPCASDADCADKDNADKCDGAPYCDKATGQCQNNSGKQVSCPTGQDSACKKAACIKTSGQCQLLAVEQTEEICAGQVCRRVALPTGVTGTLNSPCSDGDTCTVGDVCGGGLCKPGKDTCACKSDKDCEGQDDGDLCNGTLFCNLQTGKCLPNPSSVVSCPSVDDTVCIKNTCEPKTGTCAPKTVQGGTKCDDGDPCTKSSFCFGGLCGGGTFVCACAKDADCLNKDDGDLCNGVPYCDKTDPKSPKCLPNPASKVFCSPANDTACAKNTCDPKTGACANKPAANGGSCDDGDVCTLGDACKGGACAGAAKSCDDGSLCTQDVCKPGEGCVHTKANCSDGNSCTVDLCDPKTGLCAFDAAPLEGKACAGDTDGCTVGERCTQGVCGGGKAVTCVLPTKACEVASCVSTGPKSFQCVVAAAPSSQPCDDSDACTLGDHCGPKGCVPGGGTPLYARRLPGPVTVGVAEAVAVWPDHDVVLVGTRGTAQAGMSGWAVTRLSRGGDERWSRQLPLSGQHIYVKPAAVWPGDKGTIVVAGTWKTGSDHRGRVLTLSTDGQQILGDVAWGSASAHEYVQAAASDGVGGAWLLGTRPQAGKPGQLTAFVARVNVDGKPLSAQDFAAGQASRVGGHALRPGGGHVVGVERYNAQGQPNTCRIFALTGAGAHAWSSAALPMNRLDGVAPVGLDSVAVGASADVSVKPVVVRLESTGKVRWVKQLALTGAFFAALPQPGGGVVVAGHSGNWDKPTALLVGVGPLGSVAWQQGVTDPAGGAFLALTEDSDGALVAAGLAAVQVGNPDTRRPLVARTTAWGGLVCSAAGKCLGLAPATCDDKNDCTDDLCGSKGGCVHLNHSAPCDDGDPCTTGDACKAGKCAPKAATDCTADGPCALGSCKAGLGCVETPRPVGTSCDDGDACTSKDVCGGSGACAGSTISCDDGVACTQDACDPKTGCSHAPQAKACDDGNGCTDNTCAPGDNKADGKGCVAVANQAPCDDGVACTVGAVCAGGSCSKGLLGKLWLTDLGATSDATYKGVDAHATDVAPWPGGGVAVGAVLQPRAGQHNAWGFGGPAAPKPAATVRSRVARIGPTGTKIWDRLVGQAGKLGGSELVRAVVPDSEGVVAFGHGSTGAKGAGDGFAVALAAKDGATRWLFRYGTTSHERIYDAARLGDDFVAAGATDGTATKSTDGWVLWVSKLGFQTQAVAVGGTAHERVNAIAVDTSAKATRIAFAGTRKMAADDDLWWGVLDGAGKLLWERVTYLTGRHDYGARVVFSPDGGVVAAGAHFALSGTQLPQAALLAAAGPKGRARWRKVHTEDSWSTSQHGLPIAALGVTGGELLAWGHRTKPGRAAWRLRLSDGDVLFTGKTRGQGVEAPDLHGEAGVVLPSGGVAVAGFNSLGPGSAIAVARSDLFGAVSCKVAGACADKAAKDCDDGNACTQRECTGGACVHDALQGVACDGKVFCTATHACDDKGGCAAASPQLFDTTVNANAGSKDAKRLEGRNHVAATDDGGWVATGWTRRSHPNASCCSYDEAMVRRYDAAGALQWSTTLSNAGTTGGNYYVHAFRVLPRDDGGFLVVGRDLRALGPNLNQRSVYAMISTLTAYGQRTAQVLDRLPKTELHYQNRGFYGAARVGAGRYLVTGFNTDKANQPQVWLYALDVVQGAIKPVYSVLLGPGSGLATDVVLNPKGEAVFTDSLGTLGYADPKTGKLLGWAKPADTTGKSLGGLAVAGDGILATGSVSGAAYSGKRAAYAARYDADRKVLWEKTYDGAGADTLVGAVALGDGRFAATGTVDVAAKSTQLRLLLFGADGGALSDKDFGGAVADAATGLTQLTDSRLLVLGNRGSGTTSDGLLKTFTAWGHDQCVTAGYCADTPLPACDDDNLCTTDSCAPGKGCTHTTLSDGHSCGGGKQCKGGVCGG